MNSLKYRNRSLFAIALMLLVLGVQDDSFAQDREGINTITHLDNGNVLLENFEQYKVGTIPAEWYNQKGEGRPATYNPEDKAAYKYSVKQEDGNKFLHYEGKNAKHLNFPLLNKDINIYETPILSWKWRIHKIPEGASEKEDNDVAASIYVVYDLGQVLFKKVPKSIRYTWSSTLDKGTELTKFFGNQKIIVVGTGNNKKGKWQTFQRNIVADYIHLFGEKPPKTPLAILILSDGDNTNTIVKADYDDIMLKKYMN